MHNFVNIPKTTKLYTFKECTSWSVNSYCNKAVTLKRIIKANRICPHSACGFKKKKGVRNDSKIWGLSKCENGGKMREIRGRTGL